jgi:hypothetical protein
MKCSCQHWIFCSKCHYFFAYVHIKAIKDMVHENVALFQEIWEQTNEK